MHTSPHMMTTARHTQQRHAQTSLRLATDTDDVLLCDPQGCEYPLNFTGPGANCAITFCTTGAGCQGSCAVSAHSGVKGALNGSNGQACYWFSNGCTSGCDKCDGSVNHHGRGAQQFLYKGMNQSHIRANKILISDRDLWYAAPGDMVIDPATKHTLKIAPGCAKPNGKKPTICKSSLRTLNSQAECGGDEDFTYWAPWRAP